MIRAFYLLLFLFLMVHCKAPLQRAACPEVFRVKKQVRDRPPQQLFARSRVINRPVRPIPSRGMDEYPVLASASGQLMIEPPEPNFSVYLQLLPHEASDFSTQPDDPETEEMNQPLKVVADTLKPIPIDPNYKKARTLGHVSFWTSWAFPLFLVSLITGALSLKSYQKTANKKGKTLPILGIILGVLGGLISLLFLLIIWAYSTYQGG
ncbi:hypothetical protein [Marinoscillum sp.]|uniref:hypothetical protein n=1 Tax=Marinoscillum sp. TaxID=2024838 RepID=UPI003BA89E69